MRALTGIALLMGLAACSGSDAGAGGGAEEGTPSVSSELTEGAPEVAGFLLGHPQAMERRDSTALRGMYAESFTWLEDGSVRYRSLEEILSALAALPEGMATRTVIGEVEVREVAEGGAMHAWTPFSTTVGSAPDAVTFTGVLGYVLERAPDGRWRIVGGHTSTDTSGGI